MSLSPSTTLQTKSLINWLASPSALPAIRAAKQRRDFGAWLSQVSPTWQWQWRHLEHIRAQLDRVTRGEIDRLMLFLPPRHGKSEMVTIRYPVWRLEREPERQIIVAAYNQLLANTFSRKARRIAEERLALSDDRAAVDDWETAQGGRFRAVGVGSGVTGQGGDLIIIDDPVKSREEAASETYRERVWGWYREDLYTRLAPSAAMILIMTRWHEDDLAGRILASDDGPNWTVVKLPALAEESDPLGRDVGAALCPERFGVDALSRIRSVLGSRSFWALYQQAPQPAEGDLIKRHWFDIVDGVPANAPRVRYWDFAATEGGGAFTAGVLLAHVRGVYYVCDVKRGQWSTGQREQLMRQTADLDRQAQAGDVAVWFEQEPGSSGVDAMQATIRAMAGFNVHADRATGSKDTRLMPFAAQAEAGNVKLVRGPWNEAFLDELTSVPNGKYRDQADAVAGAFNQLARQSRGYSVYNY